MRVEGLPSPSDHVSIISQSYNPTKPYSILVIILFTFNLFIPLIRDITLNYNKLPNGL